MSVIKVKKTNGQWQDVATADIHTHTVSDISDLPASIVNDVEALKDKVGADSVAYQINTALESMGEYHYEHPLTHPANMITGLSNVAISGNYEDLNNIPADLATETYVQEEIAKIDVSDQLSNFASVSYVDEKFSSVGGGITEQVQSDWNETDTTSPAYIKNKPVISGEGGASVQANWNQDDSTQADYIKNRPFYEYLGLVDVHPLTQYNNFYLNSNYGVYIYEAMSSFLLTVGDSYTVSWDNIEYECVVQDVSSLLPGMVALGNCAAFGFNGNNEPFIVAVGNGYLMCVALTDTEAGGSHTIGIKKEEIVVEKIDNKYLSIMDYAEPREVEILPLTQYDYFYLDSDYGLYTHGEYETYTLTVGKNYTIYWDGTEYECVSQDASFLMAGAIALGNASAFGLSGNNEPFLIAYIAGMGVQYFALTHTENGGPHTVGIVGTADGHYVIKDEYKSDWNESDISSSSYIKNKPFSEIPAGTVIVNNTTVNCNIQLDEFMSYALIEQLNIIGGYQYEVEFDGTSHILTANNDSSGAITIIYDGDDSFFSIGINIENTGMNIFISSEGQHTFKITLAEDIIQTIDPKFIPKIDGLPEISESDNGKTLLVSEGVWSVAEPPKGVPEVTSSDNGKFLRVVDGVWTAVSVENAEEVTF